MIIFSESHEKCVLLQGTCNLVIESGKFFGYEIAPSQIPVDRMQGAVREVARVCPEIRHRNKVLDRCQPAFWPFEFILRERINSKRSSASRAGRKKKAESTLSSTKGSGTAKKQKTATDDVPDEAPVPVESDSMSQEELPSSVGDSPRPQADIVPAAGNPLAIDMIGAPVTEVPVFEEDSLINGTLQTDAVDKLCEYIAAEDNQFASSMYFKEQDPVEIPTEADAQNAFFTLFMPEQSRVKNGDWDSHANAIAKCHVLPPGAKVFGHEAPDGYRIVSLITLSQNPGMALVKVPAVEKYKGGNVDEIRGDGLRSRFESGATQFLWPKDMIYRTRKDGSLTPGGSVRWVVSPTTDSHLPRDARRVVSTRKRRN